MRENQTLTALERGSGRARVHRRNVAWVVLMAVVSTSLGLVGGIVGVRWGLGSAGASQTEVRYLARPAGAVGSTGESTDFSVAADRALPSLAFIRVELGGRDGGRQAQGSGVVFDARGLILTNDHVVNGAIDVMVRLTDGREFHGELVGGDPNSDVAVVRIRPEADEPLPAAVLGDPDELRVGDWVLALGSPLGLDFTVTAGIVSAKSRAIGILRRERGPEALESFIQTDAAINPGNSGGALVNGRGEVVGINSAITSPTGSYAGYGFAVPIDLATRIARDLVEVGHVMRPRLGISVDDATSADAAVFGLPDVQGAVVRSVAAGLPADRGGIRMGDVVVSVEREPVVNSADLTARLARRRPRETARLSIIRYGERRDIEIRLGEFQPLPTRPTAERPSVTRIPLDLRVSSLTSRVASQLGYDAESGVVVAELPVTSPAVDAGLRPGMLIRRINGETIKVVADVRRIAASWRPGQVVSVTVELPEGVQAIFNYRPRR